ncbi:MAG TPA: sensor domain-containing diguanylate cyclase [Pyrinomonadaceae bacterium]|jgi:diguanylate cyclase (GGDEF)-like protein
MSKHVILLTDVHEAPAPGLIEVLREAGVSAFFEGLRETEVSVGSSLHHASEARDRSGSGERPLAILYEVLAGADVLEIHAAVEHAASIWPGTPLIACRQKSGENGRPVLRTLDAAALKRLGFRAVADEPAQLPALLREMEERGMTGDLVVPPNEIEGAWLPGSLLLPANLRVKGLRAAFEAVASLHFAVDQKSAAQTALVGLSSLVRADRWTIYLTSETSGGEQATLEPLAARGLLATEREIPEQDWKRALMGDAIVLSGLESKAARQASARMETVRKAEKGRRILAVPLTSCDRVIAVVEAIREGERARAFSRTDTALLTALAIPVASALANSVRIAEAERLSQTDDLTKLHNARFLRQFLLTEVKRARRYGSSVASVFFDLDDFKRVNDMHGHLVGSYVLMEMSAIILSSVRDTDVVARYGGDEFVIVLPETDFQSAVRVAERLCAKIARHFFTGGRRLQLQLTASFGVASFPQHAQSPQQLVACADTAMYEAKAAGKNCVRTAEETRAASKDEKAIS